MVLPPRTSTIDGLAAVDPQHVDLPRVDQGLKRAINSGQADVLATLAQLLMEFLGGPEGVQAIKQAGDGSALSR